MAYLRRDKPAIERNPATVDRLCGRLYEIGLKNLYLRCSEPKETNRQIGPLFKKWLHKKALGAEILNTDKFLATKNNAILDGSDNELKAFAQKHLNYTRNKRLDFIAKFNNKHIIGEAKFLTDFGGHQAAQFEDAISTLKDKGANAIKIAILDGVLYITGKSKMHNFLKQNPQYNVMSALVLREFLYQI